MLLVHLAVALISGYLTVGIGLLLLGGFPPGPAGAGLILNFGVALSFLFTSIARLIRRRLSTPTPSRAAAGVLQTYAWGWFIGVGLLSARVIWADVMAWGAPPVNGSYLADALFFAAVTLFLSLPGILAILLGFVVRRVARV